MIFSDNDFQSIERPKFFKRRIDTAPSILSDDAFQ